MAEIWLAGYVTFLLAQFGALYFTETCFSIARNKSLKYAWFFMPCLLVQFFLLILSFIYTEKFLEWII